MNDKRTQDILTRLETIKKKLDGDIGITREKQIQILAERARKLAAPDYEDDEQSIMHVVKFHLANETYALECRFIKEVYPVKRLTPIPGTPDFVVGIINVRGRIVSVVDLKSFFQLPAKGLNDLTRVIIIENSNMTFGILAEEVTETTVCPVKEIQPPPPTLTGVRADYLKGIAMERLIVLDAEKLLNDDKIIIHREMVTTS
ncbi:MAG: purine-binding chemotaxis protein CheW [bacterium]|nr:purine-binding chemotaxis protein CheW [bacterium]